MKKILFLLGFLGLFLQSSGQTLYNSYLSAGATIFIDFDGHTVAGTEWSEFPLVCGPSGLDSTQINEIFNRVAEDYRPFNLNITTDSTKYWSAPANKRMRVIVTVTSAWYGPVGGTAMVGTFTSANNTPCFVFSERLGYNTKKIGEAVAHEAGHTLGLYHQSHYDAACNLLSDYHYGQGSGEIGWAPIMGVGYYQNLTLWNNGPNSFGCNSYQNDLQVITTNNGFSYRTDDHSNVFASATLVPFSGSQFNASGVIERNTDQDMFKFILNAPGRFQLGAVPYNVGTGNAGSDIDIQVTLYNHAQTLLNVYNPGTLLNSVIDSQMIAGTYYLKIEGKGNQYASNYASLGSYSVQATFTAATILPLHKFLLTGAIDNDRHLLNWEIVADEPVMELELEVSSDGIRFSSLGQPGVVARSFDYLPASASALQYRLRIKLDNGREYYSNLVTLRKRNDQSKPGLLYTMVKDNTIKISSPGKYEFTVCGLDGSVYVKGRLISGINTINTPVLAGGIYIIRYSNPEHQWTEKFVRQ